MSLFRRVQVVFREYHVLIAINNRGNHVTYLVQDYPYVKLLFLGEHKVKGQQMQFTKKYIHVKYVVMCQQKYI